MQIQEHKKIVLDTNDFKSRCDHYNIIAYAGFAFYSSSATVYNCNI